jgi:drug/metabolite transporter (DMT)-like permease
MWFWLCLASSVLGAFANIMNKKTLGKVDASVFTWSLFALSLPFLGYIAFKDSVTTVNYFFFLGAIGSAIAFVFAKTITNQAIKQSVLSKLLPLSSLSVLFTYVIGLLFLSEEISAFGVLGLVLIVLGVYVLNADGAQEDLRKPITMLFSNKLYLLFILATFLISIESLFIKIAMNNTSPLNVPLAMFGEQSLMTLFLTVYLVRTKKGWVGVVRKDFVKLFLNSLLYFVVSLMVFTAMSGTAVALVQGVKRSQLLFTLLLGIVFLNDRPTKHTWVASLLIIIGVILIKISS